MHTHVVSISQADIYQSGNKILSNVNFKINKSELVYMIGKTGSGKSSLLKTIYGDLPLINGEAQVCGMDLRKLNRKNTPLLRRKLGIIFQDFHLFYDRNVYQNLLFVLKATGWDEQLQIDTRIDEVLDMVGLAHKKKKMPHELSGGEQQRIVLARALLNHPELIIADEPTGNLDPETSVDVISVIHNIAKNSNTAVLVATHDYMVLEKFPARILKCKNHEIIEDLTLIS
jgi:cell division transport system ATP-binding protein